ncbi:MAG: DUF433 domain-containing protein [Pirellulales bacterium]
MSSVSAQYKYLERKPKSNYKQLVVKGTRIFARTLYGQYMSEEEPRTIEQIAEDYNLPIEAVREAIAYCDTDPIEIREDFAREEAIMEATGMNDPDYKYHPSRRPLAPEERARIYREVEQRFAKEREARGL